MKVKLEKLRKRKNALDAEIHNLEEQIAKADPIRCRTAAKIGISGYPSGAGVYPLYRTAG